MAAVRFPKQEVVITQPWIETSLRNLVHLEIQTLLEHAHYQTGTGSSFATSTAAIVRRHNYVASGPIHTKFGVPVQNRNRK